MKDAFGGTFILRIMLVFFVVFISFMVIAINFARTFRVTSGVVNIIERHFEENKLNEKIENYLLKEIHYSASNDTGDQERIRKDCTNRVNTYSNTSINGTGILKGGNYNGVCIVPIGTNDSYHYEVTAYIVLRAPILNLGMLIPVRSESKTFNNIFY